MHSTGSLKDFQEFIANVYAKSDDRLFSLSDLVANQGRFTMRALKGVRKQNKEKTMYNLTIAFSWTFAIANRLHIDLERSVLERFPNLCSYCGFKPCKCPELKIKKRKKLIFKQPFKSKSIKSVQKMFDQIYPSKTRSVTDAGIHLAEETGEVSEIISIHSGEHKFAQFENIKLELADWVSCAFGLANSVPFDLAEYLTTLYDKNCHICHEAPCSCNFAFIAAFDS